jgi:20S proteasome alpha/beta subunit
MTCIIGGKCKDGAVIIGDTKVTYRDHPPIYKDKMFSDCHPVVTAYAGSQTLYNQFKDFAFQEFQIKLTPSQITTSTSNVQTSGVFYTYTSLAPNPNAINYTDYHSRLEHEVKKINQEKSFSVGDEFEVLTAIQVSGKVKLTHIYPDGTPDEINEYKAIGGSHQYSYVFLKPVYHDDITMEEFARLGYFIIRYLDEYEMDEHVGGQPQFWCIHICGKNS